MGGWGNRKGGGGGGGGNYGGGGSRVGTFKIFLSGLPDGFKNHELEPMFEAFGRTIECEVFRNNFAFVHMEEEECGRNAIKALNGTDLGGKKISVVESKNNEGPNIMKMKLSVKNIPKSVTASDIRGLFKKYGRVLEAEVFPNGNGSCTLEATGDIRSAINEMNGYLIGTQQLIVEAVKVNPKAMAQQAASSGGGGGGGGGGFGSGPSQRGRQGPGPSGRGMGGLMPKRGGGGRMPSAAMAYYDDYEEEGYYQPQPTMIPRRQLQEYTLGEREYYETPQKPPSLLRPPQRRQIVQPEYYEDQEEEYYAPVAVPRAPMVRKQPAQAPYYEGYEEDETYEYDESGYYAVGQGEEEQRYAFQPPRKVAKGQPFPPPPVPPPGSVFRTPREARRDMLKAGWQFAAVDGEKKRGERGGRKKLTAGKVAYLEVMKAAGFRIPPGHIPSLLDVRATLGPRPGHQIARARFPAGGAGGGPSPNMMPVARRFAAPAQRAPAAGAVKSLQQMAMGNNAAASTSYPLPLFPSATTQAHNEQMQSHQQGDASGGYESVGGVKDEMEQNPDIDFTADIMLF